MAIKFETTIDEAAAQAIPKLRPLLGKRVEIVALDAESPPRDTGRKKLTVDEFLALRLELPPGVGPISLDDMEKAIIKGALDGNV